jgi:hypothetical protein
MLQAWKKAKVITYAGYILGFPTDTPESIARDIEIIKTELPIDILEFFYLTPLPGSEDQKKLYLSGVPMDPDMNKYDLEHACTAHPRMSKQEWEQAYNNAWLRYYSDEHVETIMRRAAATDIRLRKIYELCAIFSGSARIERVHPLQFGFFRRKVRTQRRQGMRRVNPLVFYPWRAFDVARTVWQWYRLLRRYKAIMERVKADPTAANYIDQALTPPIAGAEDHVVQLFADKIPKTHGAPVQHAADVH